jgi:hypothetical protein
MLELIEADRRGNVPVLYLARELEDSLRKENRPLGLDSNSESSE